MKADSASGSSPVGSILRALFANFGIAVIKTITAVMTGSGAMLAESIHSFADCANQLLLLLGIKESKKPESETHPFGHERVKYFYSLIVGFILFLMGGVLSIYKGFEHLFNPHPLEYVGYAILVILASIALEGYALRGALDHIKKERAGMSMLKWFKDTRSSEMIIVTGEDIAAISGLIIALISLLIAYVTGNSQWDALGSILVGVLLVCVSVFIVLEIKSMIKGESAAPSKHQAMKKMVMERPEIKTLYRFNSLQWGAFIIVTIEAEMHKTGSEIGLIDATNRVETSLKEAFPDIKYIYFEPDRNKEVHEYEDEEMEDEVEQVKA